MRYKPFYHQVALALTVALFVLARINIATAQVIPGSYIVVFKDDVVSASAASASLAQAHGLTVEHTYSFALKGFAANIPAGRLADLQQDPRVAYVEPNLIARAFVQTLPSGVDRIDADLNSTANIDGVDDRVDLDIAIIDTGIDLDHPDLNVYRDHNFINPSQSGDDDRGHGTHVAGTAAALDNGIGVVGVAPGARLWALKVLDAQSNGSFAHVIDAVDFVTQHANQIEVVNMSLGGFGRLNALRTAIQNSVNAGVVYVVAAGNDSRDVYGPDGIFNTNDDTIPAAYPEVATISAMADFDGQPGGLDDQERIFRLCSHRGDDVFGCFTNFSRNVIDNNPVMTPGGAIDLAAPGVDIFSTLPGGTYGSSSGTSMASPHVAGSVALYIAENGRATNAEEVYAIRQALINTTQPQNVWGPADTQDPDANPEGLLMAIPTVLVLANETINDARVYQAVESITAGPSFVIESDGDVIFRAGKMIRLQSGFRAERGSKFHAYIDGPSVDTPIASSPALATQSESKTTVEDIYQPPPIDSQALPEKNLLLPNYPNPFNPETWIPYALAVDSHVTLTIYDFPGRLIRTIHVGYRRAARYQSKDKAIYWDGRNDSGERVASGIYYYRLTAGDYTAIRKMLILK